MFKKLATLGAVLAFTAFTLPSLASASSLTSQQISSIVTLLQAFGATSSTIANVQAALTGQPSTSTVSASCVSLTTDLYAGETDAQTNGQVSQLQSFLNVNPTGYFGPLTEQAVQNYQSSHSIVSSGSPDTTGYGFVGPVTRGSMGCSSNTPSTNSTVTNTNGTTESTSTSSSMQRSHGIVSFSATPSSVSAGTQVQLSWVTRGEDSCQVDAVSGGSSMSIKNLSLTGTLTITPQHTAQYELTCTSTWGNQSFGATFEDKKDVTVTVPGSVTAEASIDQSTLTSNSANPTISGTATGLNSIVISILGVSTSTKQISTDFFGAPIPVINNKWSTTINGINFLNVNSLPPSGGNNSGLILENGTYQVTIYNSASEVISGPNNAISFGNPVGGGILVVSQ